MSQRQRYFLLSVFLCLASTMLVAQSVTINLAADSGSGANNRCAQNGVEGGNMIVHAAPSTVTFSFSGAASLTIVLGNCSTNCTLTSSGSTLSTPTPTPSSAVNPMTYTSIKTNAGTVLCNPNGDGLVMR